MLKKQYRITKEKEFQIIYRRGRYQAAALFSINYLPSRQNVSRIGIVVSKKVTKKATERNLLKRRVRDIAKEIHKEIKGNFDIVISIKPGALGADFQVMKAELSTLFKNAGLVQ